MPVEFGRFSPDLAGHDANILDLAENVLPLARGYGPANALLPVSAAVGSGETPLTLATVQTASGAYLAFLLTSTKAYKQSNLSLIDVTNTGGDYAATEAWATAQFGSNFIAVTKGVTPQSIDIETGTEFADEADIPDCGGVAVIDDYALYYRQVDNPRLLTWSDVNDFSNTSTGLSDSQEFPDGGEIQHVAPQTGLIIQETAIRQIVPTADETVFSFRLITAGQGTIAPFSCIRRGSVVAYYSQDGFKMAAGTDVADIGRDMVDEWFRATAYAPRISQMQGAFDPYFPRFVWSFATTDSDLNDMLIGFDYRQKAWWVASVETFCLSTAAQPGSVLEDLDTPYPDVDAMEVSLDSSIFAGGKPLLSAVGADRKIGYFEGETLPARILTGNYNFGQGERASLTGVRPYIVGSSCSLRVNRRAHLGTPANWTAVTTMQRSGKIPCKADGFQHQLEFTIPAGEDWNKFTGFDPFFVPTGKK